jgi:hypothetical protein
MWRASYHVTEETSRFILSTGALDRLACSPSFDPFGDVFFEAATNPLLILRSHVRLRDTSLGNSTVERELPAPTTEAGRWAYRPGQPAMSVYHSSPTSMMMPNQGRKFFIAGRGAGLLFGQS